MNVLDLYKFVKNNNLEFHYIDEDKDVVLFVEIYHVKEFNEMLGSGIFDDAGIQCNMKQGYFCFKMDEICAYFDIELKDIFNKEDEK